MWVMRRREDGDVEFWESLSGKRWNHTVEGSPRYHRIGCVFSQDRLFANVQRTDLVAKCSFDLFNRSHWKQMDTDLLAAMPRQRTVPLRAPKLDTVKIAEATESTLRDAIGEFRRTLGLTTRWSKNLGYLLGPALTTYEHERISGTVYGNDLFQQSVRRVVPEGAVFRAFPIMFNHESTPRKIMRTLEAREASRLILNTRGDSVTFAVRTRVFAFPEDVYAIWIILAVMFFPPDDDGDGGAPDSKNNNAKSKR